MLPLFAQELETSCVAACVRMALGDLGHHLTEAEIRARCGHTRLGMRLNQIADGLKGLPVLVSYHTDWSLDDLNNALRQSAFPIVGVDLRPIDGIFAFHALVVVNITSDHAVVHDPMHEHSPRSIGLAAFDAAWDNADRETIVITNQLSV